MGDFWVGVLGFGLVVVFFFKKNTFLVDFSLILNINAQPLLRVPICRNIR